MLLIYLAALVWQPCAHQVYRASHCVLSAVLSLCCGLDDKQIAFAHIDLPDIPSPVDHGYHVTETRTLEPLWFEGDVIPMVLVDILEEN